MVFVSWWILVCPRRLPSGAWMRGACFFIGHLRSLVVRALERYSKDPVRVPVEMHVFRISSIIQINTPTPLALLYASSLWALIWALQYRLQQKCSLLFSYNVLNKIKFTFILLKYINIHEQCCSPNKIIGAGGGKMGCNIESGLSFKALRFLVKFNVKY